MAKKEKGGIAQSPPESGAQPEIPSEPLEQNIAQGGGEVNAGEPANTLNPLDVALSWTRTDLESALDNELQAAHEVLTEHANGDDPRLADRCQEALEKLNTEIRFRTTVVQAEANGAADPNEDDPLAIEWLRDAKIKPYDWLEHGWLARETVTLFTSEPKQGKSTLAAKLAADVSNRPDGGIALMCYLESAASIEHWPRMLAAGADKERVARMVKPTTESGTSFAMNVRKAITHHDLKPDLIVVDPLATVAGDTNSSKEARAAMNAFQGLADEFDCGVLVVHHNNKQTKGRMAVGSVMDLSAGSQQIAGAARIIWQLHPNPDNEDDSPKLPPVAIRVAVNTDEPLGPDAYEVVSELTQIENDEGEKVWARRVTGLNERDGDVMAELERKYAGRASNNENDDEVLDALESQLGDWMTTTAIAKASGLKRRTADYRLKALAKKNLIEVRKHEGQGGGHEYRVTTPRF